MKQSDSIKELAGALVKAQLELKNPQFDSINPHFKSKFASLGAVRGAVVPTLAKNGIALTQWPISSGSSAGCRTILAHLSGEWMEEEFLIPVDKGNAHGYASAVTYAKRITMQSVAGVVGDEDDDANAAVEGNLEGAKGQGVPPRGSAADVKKDAFEALPKAQQEAIRKIAADTIALIEEDRAYDAYGFVVAQRLEADEQAGLQHLFSAPQRTALKKAAEQWKLEAAATTNANRKAA